MSPETMTPELETLDSPTETTLEPETHTAQSTATQSVATLTPTAPVTEKQSRKSAEQTVLDVDFSDREGRWKSGKDWPVIAWLVFLHAGALAAPFFFTWKAVALTFILGWLTGGIGICLGYHRLLTHGSFQTYKPMRRLIATLGTLAGEGSPLMWVSTHRKHHVHSDHEGDPHSPKHGGFWSHMLWLFPDRGGEYKNAMFQRYSPDLLKDPYMRMLDKTFLLWHWGLGLALFAIGYFGWNAYTGWSFVFWGVFVRLVYVLHSTWFVNSATHMWGYRNYQTTDDSRNLWWVAALTYGEGWHNNHHAHQRMARHGHRWWEVDVTYLTILAMEKVGLAWKVVHDVPGRKLHAEVVDES